MSMQPQCSVSGFRETQKALVERIMELTGKKQNRRCTSSRDNKSGAGGSVRFAQVAEEVPFHETQTTSARMLLYMASFDSVPYNSPLSHGSTSVVGLSNSPSKDSST
eukprot:m.252964 g.252964  ORF g.252964 m.252964 type:complete len:107 (+) comp17529_c0_seq2:100-420(+)